MWWKLDEAINESAKRQIQKFEKYARGVSDENLRRQRRDSTTRTVRINRPEYWKQAPGFNPYHVRAHARQIAFGITEKLKNGEYSPCKPAGFYVPKASGGKRMITVFEIADEVVSNFVYQSLLKKNNQKFSSHAYAYRPSLGPHDAISYIQSSFSSYSRLYIAEFDFSKFFDNVQHSYIYSMIDKLDIRMTGIERHVIDAFLRAEQPEMNSSPIKRVKGLPQGTSLSLFLANLAATEMDRRLESLGVGFARYADDTLIWSPNYERIANAAEIIYEESGLIGSPINGTKSGGISLLVPKETTHAEMALKYEVGFLGHAISLDKTKMKNKTVEKIKHHIEQLIFHNLLSAPSKGSQEPSRLTDIDRDYVTLIWQLRRYLYGSISEGEIRKYQRSTPKINFKGVMAFFPLITDDSQLQQLDIWLMKTIWLSLRKREKLLKAKGISAVQPHGATKDELANLRIESSTTHREVDLRIPSFQRIAHVIRQGVNKFGFEILPGSSSLYLYEKIERITD